MSEKPDNEPKYTPEQIQTKKADLAERPNADDTLFASKHPDA